MMPTTNTTQLPNMLRNEVSEILKVAPNRIPHLYSISVVPGEEEIVEVCLKMVSRKSSRGKQGSRRR